MNKLLSLGFFLIFLWSCSSSQTATPNTTNPSTNDTVRIANDELQYEVIIMEPGFNAWLATARPRGYYSETFLEERNRLYVQEWNSRVRQPFRYKSSLYEMEINYDRNIHYGYEVNYLIYNYFVYFQQRHKQQLGGFAPRP